MMVKFPHIGEQIMHQQRFSSHCSIFLAAKSLSWTGSKLEEHNQLGISPEFHETPATLATLGPTPFPSQWAERLDSKVPQLQRELPNSVCCFIIHIHLPSHERYDISTINFHKHL